MAVPMMWFSKKAVYALQALTAMARDNRGKPRQVQELAENQGIPVKFLEQILLGLKRQGILHSKRGVGGGYQLARTADHIGLVEVLEAVDGPFHGPEFPPAAARGLTEFFSELNHELRERLEHTTIADILAREVGSESLSFEI